MKFKELQKIVQDANYSIEKNSFRTLITKKVEGTNRIIQSQF